MRRRRIRAVPFAAAAIASATVGVAQDERYLRDYEFLCATIREHAASLTLRDIDWAAVSKPFEARFRACTSDVEHVANCMELIALLGDGHSGVRSHQVDGKALPSKFDGLYGGGMLLRHEHGRTLLAGLMAGHPLADRIAPGALLVAIDGLPAWLALERQRRRIARYQGTSSDHSLFASLANRLLPFGDRQTLPLVFRGADGTAIAVDTPRWGPGGTAWSAFEHEAPAGTTFADGAVARALEHDGIGTVGYLRITGKMDDATERAVHAAIDTLRDAKAIVLDCRGMGGGSDSVAWAIAARFFPKGFDNGQHGRVAPSGAWQFDGPVAMLQDSLEVSSAETLTWAMSETGRVLSIGQPTGGWAIIPRMFECPSGLLAFRIGVNARTTPIRRVQTEGTGWPPDLAVPFGPVLGADAQAPLRLSLDLLQLECAGMARDDLRTALGRLGAGDGKAFVAAVEKALPRDAAAKATAARLRDAFAADLEARLREELAVATDADLPVPDVAGMQARCELLQGVAAAAGLAKLHADWRRALGKLAPEANAQRDLLALLDASFAPCDAAAAAAFGRKHGRTRTAKAAAPLLEPARR